MSPLPKFVALLSYSYLRIHYFSIAGSFATVEICLQLSQSLLPVLSIIGDFPIPPPSYPTLVILLAKLPDRKDAVPNFPHLEGLYIPLNYVHISPLKQLKA